MTAPTALDAPDAGEPSTPLTTGTGTRSQRRRRERQRARRRLALYVAVVVCLFAAVPTLTWTGYRALLHSRSGRLVDRTVATGGPNFETIVEPTPVALVVQEGADGLEAVTVLAVGPGGSGGGVVIVPRLTVPDLAGAFAADGAAGVARVLGSVLGLGFTETLRVDAERWGQLVAPVAPVRVEAPGEGVVDVSGDDVAGYLAVREPGEPVAAQLARQEAFWRGWLDEFRTAQDPAAVPGEGTAGMSRYVRALVTGRVVMRPLPGEEVEVGDGLAFRVDADAAQEAMLDLVPFPSGSELGARVRVRLLDGSDRIEVRDEAVRPLVAAGAQITV
ncbi:MAG: hypothetical protein ACRD0U_16215, partial [Acidimicrobiales bacterium]